MTQSNATLVIRHHRVSNDDDDGNEPDELFSHLYQVCTYHLEVRGLASGRSGSVSGEVGSCCVSHLRAHVGYC